MASSIHSEYYYSDYILNTSRDHEFSSSKDVIPSDPFATGSEGSTTSEMHSEETHVPFFDNYGDHQVLLTFDSSDHISSSYVSMASALRRGPAERNGEDSDTGVAAALLFPDHERASLFANYYSGAQCNINIANYQLHPAAACHSGEELCSGMASLNSWPTLYNHPNITTSTADNIWELEAAGRLVHKVEEPTLKIARYSAEERKDRILRYLKKRTQRNFNKTIKYACRKTLADKRVRVRGRFAKNINELCEDHDQMNTDLIHNDLCFNINPAVLQMKAHDEEWFQDTLSNLMYYHIFPDNLMQLP